MRQIAISVSGTITGPVICPADQLDAKLNAIGEIKDLADRLGLTISLEIGEINVVESDVRDLPLRDFGENPIPDLTDIAEIDRLMEEIRAIFQDKDFDALVRNLSYFAGATENQKRAISTLLNCEGDEVTRMRRTAELMHTNTPSVGRWLSDATRVVVDHLRERSEELRREAAQSGS